VRYLRRTISNSSVEEKMKRATRIAAVFLLPLFLAATPLSAAEFGTAQEAKAMLERATPIVKADKASAFAKFIKGEDGFKDRDLYVFCFNSGDGTINAGPPTVIGKDVRTLKDKNGDAYGQRIYDSAKEGTITEVSYLFPRPGSTEPVQKHSYVTKVGDQVCGVGYYQ
jgi:signal transduction histidine kinase